MSYSVNLDLFCGLKYERSKRHSGLVVPLLTMERRNDNDNEK